jgi:hypothetical protein
VIFSGRTEGRAVTDFGEVCVRVDNAEIVEKRVGVVAVEVVREGEKVNKCFCKQGTLQNHKNNEQVRSYSKRQFAVVNKS